MSVFARRRGAVLPRILLVLLAAAAVRCAYLVAYRASPFFEYYRNDQLYYRAWGLQIAAGNLLGEKVFEQGPLYAYVLGPLFRVFGPQQTPVLVFQLLCGLATVLLASRCARAAFGERAGLIAAALAALYGPFVFFECMVMKTFLEPLLVLGALAAALRGAATGRARWFAAAGASIGLACLVREVHALLLAPLLAAVFIAQPASAPSRRLRAATAAGALAAFLAVIAPAAVRNWVVAREPVAVSSAGGQNMYLAFGPYATGGFTLPPFASSYPYQEHDEFREEAILRVGRRLSRRESSLYWLGEAARWVRQSPALALDLVVVKAGILFNDYEVPDNENYGVARELIPLLKLLPTFGWVVGAGCVGFALALRRGGPGRLVAGFAAALVLEVLLTFNLGRYRAGLAALWLILAAGWLDWLLCSMPCRGTALARRAGAVGVAAILTLAAFRDPPRLSGERIARERETFRAEVLEGADFAARIPVLRGALDAQGVQPPLLGDLGLALEIAGWLPEALLTYEEVLRLAPDAVPVRFKLGDMYARTGNLDRAAHHAGVLAAQLPAVADAHALLGTILMKQALRDPGDQRAARLLEDAEAAVRRAIALRPFDAALRVLRGRILMLAGRDAAALSELTIALDLAPGLESARHLSSLLRGRPRSSL